MVDEEKFWKIVESQIQLVKEKEREMGGDVDIQIQYSSEMSVLPFSFIIPEHAEYSFKTYHSDGSKIEHAGEPLGIVSEKKGEINFTRDLDDCEKSNMIFHFGD